jgi:hypothetical protein
VVVVLLALVGVALLHLWWTSRRQIGLAWQQRQPWVGYLLLATVALVISRVVEKTHVPVMYFIEETAELAFAALLLWMILALRGGDGTARE